MDVKPSSKDGDGEEVVAIENDVIEIDAFHRAAVAGACQGVTLVHGPNSCQRIRAILRLRAGGVKT